MHLRALAFLLCTAALAPAATWELKLLNGKTVSGDLVSIDDKGITVKSADGNVTTPLSEVVQIDPKPVPAVGAPGAAWVVELTDGSTLACKPDGFVLDGKDADLTLLSGLKVRTPIKALAYVLKNGLDPAVRGHTDWVKLLKKKGSFDQVVVEIKNEIIPKGGGAKSVEIRYDAATGTLGEGKGLKIDFVREGASETGNIDFAGAKWKALIFANRLDVGAAPTLCKVQDAHQSTFKAAKIEAANDKEVKLTLVGGPTLTYDADKLIGLDFSSGKIEYLSDWHKPGPRVEVEPPAEQLHRWKYVEKNDADKKKPDLNLEKKPIQVEGKEYAKGLCLPTPTVLVFDLKGDFQEFIAVLGVDEKPYLPGTAVKVVIEADNKEVFTTKFEGSKDKGVPVRLNIKDVQELRISVKTDQVLGFGHVNLANARVQK